MRIVVIGGTGRIGSNVVRRLNGHGGRARCAPGQRLAGGRGRSGLRRLRGHERNAGGRKEAGAPAA